MNILALDTATTVSSLALLKDDEALSELNTRVRNGHAGSILPAIDTLLHHTGMDRRDIDLIAVGLGPGSFTGIRIGIATARGLSMALGCPLKGICTLDALVHGAVPNTLSILPVIDARKGEVFCARYAPDGTRETPYQNRMPSTLGELVDRDTLVIGNGLPLYRDAIAAALGSRFHPGPDALGTPRATVIGRLAAEGKGSEQVEPIYVRASDAMITLQNARRS